MSARKSPNAAERILRGHQAARREYLDQLIEHLESGVASGVTLTNAEVLTALRVLEDVQAGYDPRPYLGITPKPGPRATTTVRDELLAAYVMRLALEHPRIPIKAHCVTAATYTSYPMSRIRKAVSEYREAATLVAGQMDTDTLREMLCNLAVFQRSPGEPRKK